MTWCYAFTNNIPWNKYVSEVDELRKFTKADIVKFANDNYKDNYVAVYKRTGRIPTARKLSSRRLRK